MDGRRIRIKSQISLLQFIMICIILCTIVAGLLYFLFNDSSASYKTKSNSWELIGFVLFIIPLLYRNLLKKEEYLSDIYVYSDTIKLVYKVRNKVEKEIVLDKNNIQKFKISAKVDVVQRGKYVHTNSKYRLFIDLIEGRDINLYQISDVELTEANYKFIYRLLDNASQIPNFELDFDSNSDVIKAEVDYYKMFGRKLPFWTRFNMEFSKTPLIARILLIVPLVCFIFAMSMMIYSSIPVQLSKTEKQYIWYLQSADSYQSEKEYDLAIRELDKAKAVLSSDPHLYYRYAYIYKRKKDYARAIQYAKLGVTKLDNPHTYYKQYKYVKSSTDLYLYQLLGECYEKLEEYESALRAYDYLVKNVKYKHSDKYFNRGRMYYQLGRFQEAKDDFLKHEEIVLDYIDYERKSEYKSRWPKYTQKHLDNTYKWIRACEYYSRHHAS